MKPSPNHNTNNNNQLSASNQAYTGSSFGSILNQANNIQQLPPSIDPENQLESTTSPNTTTSGFDLDAAGSQNENTDQTDGSRSSSSSSSSSIITTSLSTNSLLTKSTTIDKKEEPAVYLEERQKTTDIKQSLSSSNGTTATFDISLASSTVSPVSTDAEDNGNDQEAPTSAEKHYKSVKVNSG